MTPTAALALAIDSNMIVHSDLLGPITVSPDELIRFTSGLYGFPECRAFALVPSEREGLYWLQSAEESPLAFLLVDPFLYFPGYAVDVSAAELVELGAEDAADIAVLAIVSLPGNRDEQPTANLQGPLALNLRAGTGKQLAISDSDYGVRVPFDLMNRVES